MSDLVTVVIRTLAIARASVLQAIDRGERGDGDFPPVIGDRSYLTWRC